MKVTLKDAISFCHTSCQESQMDLQNPVYMQAVQMIAEIIHCKCDRSTGNTAHEGVHIPFADDEILSKEVIQQIVNGIEELISGSSLGGALFETVSQHYGVEEMNELVEIVYSITAQREGANTESLTSFFLRTLKTKLGKRLAEGVTNDDDPETLVSKFNQNCRALVQEHAAQHRLDLGIDDALREWFEMLLKYFRDQLGQYHEFGNILSAHQRIN